MAPYADVSRATAPAPAEPLFVQHLSLAERKAFRAYVEAVAVAAVDHALAERARDGGSEFARVIIGQISEAREPAR